MVVKDDKETESDEAMKEVKQKVAKASKFAKENPSSKKEKTSRIDELIKQAKFIVKPPMSLDQSVDEIVKNGNLKPMSKWYENFDENGKRILEEATIKYLHDYSIALIQIMSKIPKSLYNILEMRRQTNNKEDKRLREYVVVNICYVISKEEIDRILKEPKNQFRRKTTMNKIMIGQIDEVIKATEAILRKVLLQNQYEVIPKKTQHDLETKKTKVHTPSILEVQTDNKEEVNVLKDARDEDAADKGEEEIVVDNKGGVTQNPSDQSMESQALIIDNTGLK